MSEEEEVKQETKQITEDEFLRFKLELKQSSIRMINNSMTMFVVVKMFEDGGAKEKLEIKTFVDSLANDVIDVHKKQSLLSFKFTEKQEEEMSRILKTTVAGSLVYINQAIAAYEKDIKEN